MTVYACWSKEPWETALLVSVHKTKFGAWRAGRRWLLAEYEDWEESRREFGHKDAAKPDRLRFFVKETTVETQAPTGDATSDPRLPHSSELLPCPFCGQPPRVVEMPEDIQIFCICEPEPLVEFDRPSRPEAVKAWNTRAGPSPTECSDPAGHTYGFILPAFAGMPATVEHRPEGAQYADLQCAHCPTCGADLRG